MRYQDDFLIPGISPRLANSLKQILQRAKKRIYPRLLPHLKQRLIILVENLGFFFDFAICDSFAMVTSADNESFTNVRIRLFVDGAPEW